MTRTQRHPRRTGRLALISLALIFMPLLPTIAQHDHAAAPAALRLDDGKKWPTDAALREGMAAIRDAVAAEHDAIVADETGAAGYAALAARLDQHSAYIVKNCRLPAAADAALHVILADVINGASLMKNADPSSRRLGAEKAINALDLYPQYFSDPGWRPLR